MTLALPRFAGVVLGVLACAACGETEVELRPGPALEGAGTQTGVPAPPCIAHGISECYQEAQHDIRDAELDDQQRQRDDEVRAARAEGYESGLRDGERLRTETAGPPWWAEVDVGPLDMSGYRERAERMGAAAGDD